MFLQSIRILYIFHMKKILAVLALGFVLAACSHQAPVEEGSSSEPTVRFDKSENIAGEGDVCGGLEKVPCDMNLTCDFDENLENATGVCVNTVVDSEVECDQSQAPLCGMRDGQKNAYQNECQLNRHGADLIAAGFCVVDSNVKGSCEAKAVGIGTCYNSFTAYEFDGTSCVKRNLGGCEAEIPFETLEACEAKCL